MAKEKTCIICHNPITQHECHVKFQKDIFHFGNCFTTYLDIASTKNPPITNFPKLKIIPGQPLPD
jgi:hypothetical protein